MTYTETIIIDVYPWAAPSEAQKRMFDALSPQEQRKMIDAAIEDGFESGLSAKTMMKTPPHPGLSVRHDCLVPLGLNVTEAAKRLGISRKQLSDIVNCHAGISPKMAIRLNKAFGGGADTWLRLQAAYDLAQAMQHADEIKVERLSPAA